MLYTELYRKFNRVFHQENYELKNMTTFGVGGRADSVCYPSTKEELFGITEFLTDKCDYCILGSGSNVLISDEGFRGVVIKTDRLCAVKLRGTLLEAECGARLSTILKICAENSMTGLEFCVNIPGTIGGLIAMNGGCFSKNIGDAVCFVKAKDGVYNREDCKFGYRTSRFLSGEAIYSAGLVLKAGEIDIIEQKTERFKGARQAKQPTGKSCGSCFKNEGFFAGKLIDQAGLKGVKIGGARVSEKHANFIINEGGSASDIYKLLQLIKRTVYERLGIELHEEVRFIGNFDESKF